MRRGELLLIPILMLYLFGVTSCSVKVVNSSVDAQSDIGGGIHLLTEERYLRQRYDLGNWSTFKDLTSKKNTVFVTREFRSLYDCIFDSAAIDMTDLDFDMFNRNNSVVGSIELEKSFNSKEDTKLFTDKLVRRIADVHEIDAPKGDFTINCPATLVILKTSKKKVYLKVKLNPSQIDPISY